MSSSNRIPLEGVLNCWNDDHDLPDLLLFVCRTKKTGRLAFSNPEGDKTLHVRSGRIVFAESSSGDDGLGHYLLRTGKISLMDYLRVSKLVEPGKRLGALLVAEGVMEPKDLAPAVLGQVRSIILGLFRRTETWYRFKEESLSSETITLDLPVESLILDGVRQVESWRRISKGVGQLESQYRSVEEKQAEWEGANFPPVVEELFEMLRRPVSVAEICTQATLPDFEACRYLWAFRCLGWAEPLDEKPKTANTDTEAEAEAAAHAKVGDTAEPHVAQPSQPAPPQPTAAAPPRPSPSSKLRRPTIIPQQLIQTQIAIEPPKLKPAKSSTGTTQRISPAPVILDQEQSDSADDAREAPSSPARTESTDGAAPKPPPIPANLAQTNLAIEPPSSKAKPEPPETKDTPSPVPAAPPTPKPIPPELAHTNLAIEPPKATVAGDEEKKSTSSSETPSLSPVPPVPVPPKPTAPSGPAPPKPIPEELAHTNLAVEPPSAKPTDASKAPEPEPPTRVASLPPASAGSTSADADADTDDAVAEAETRQEPESSRGPDSEVTEPSMADVVAGGLDQTQLFIEAPEGPGAPSPGEMMESILSNESSPDVHRASTVHSLVSDPDLDPEAHAKEDSSDEDGPAGFEALAFDDSDPSISSIENLSMPGTPSSSDFSEPEPTSNPTPPPPSPGVEEVDAMASFQDLAYAPEPVPEPAPESQPEPEAEPAVESTVASEAIPVFEAEPDGPPAEPPIVAPPPPPPRKRGADDDFDLDRDGFTHLITRNND